MRIRKTLDTNNRLIDFYFMASGKISSANKVSKIANGEEEKKNENNSNNNLLTKKTKKEEKVEFLRGNKQISSMFANKKNTVTLETENKKIVNRLKFEKLKEIMNTFGKVEVNYANLPDISLSTQVNIYSWNVNGIRAIIRKGNIEEFIEKEKPDILCVNETKIDSETLEKVKFNQFFFDKGYASFWNCSRYKKGYSGVAILTRYRPLNVTYGLNIEEHDGEGRALTLEYSNFFLVAVYVPNSGDGCRRLDYRVNRWDIALRDYLNRLKTIKDVILCGDMNVAHNEIDLKNPKANEGCACFTIEERHSFTDHLNSGFIDTFRHLYPTRIKYSYFSHRSKTAVEKNVGWRLDYFIVNQEALPRLVDSEILTEYRGSDHTPIKISWKM